jgi:signal transduction histidine kinase
MEKKLFKIDLMNTIKESQLLELTIYTCLAFLLMALVLILFFYFSRKKIIQIELENKKLEVSYQKELANAVIVIQESERKRIAQNLHDDISSKLNIISINTHLLKKEDLTDSEKKEITDIIINNTKLVSDDSRRIAHDLLPPVLQNFGLHAGINEMCSDLSQLKSLNIKYSNQIEFDIKDNDKHLHLFRILQELMTNSIKHGKSKKISISFTENKLHKTLKYSDDGIGFDVVGMKNKKGLGMKNIESRVNFLEAELKIESEMNIGSVFTINFK